MKGLPQDHQNSSGIFHITIKKRGTEMYFEVKLQRSSVATVMEEREGKKEAEGRRGQKKRGIRRIWFYLPPSRRRGRCNDLSIKRY